MGTARKPQQLRETPLQIRLTTEEKRLFLAHAQQQHLTISAWLRLAGVEKARTEDQAAPQRR